jgi:hypothetical protein
LSVDATCHALSIPRHLSLCIALAFHK